jgi:iron complex transport system substrate-binding protein
MLKINHLRRFNGPVLGGRLVRAALAGPALALVCSLFCACNGGGEQRANPAGQSGYACADSVEFATMRHSKMLRLGESCGQGVAELRSVIGRDTLVQRFALVDDSALAARGLDLGRVQRGAAWEGAAVLHVPLCRAVVLSSAQIGYMLRLGAGDRIAGVGDGRFVVDSTLYAKVAAGEVAEVGNGQGLVLEKVLKIKPELVMTFATGGGYDDYERLQALGIPMMLTSEWQEDSPLAKFEWIKLFGMMFCARSGELACAASADSVFEQGNRQYDSLTSAVAEVVKERPRVLVGMSYGGVWYAPGGRSFTAQLVRAAGGRYLWEADTTREMKLSLEEVFAIADSADVWINPGAFATPEEILKAEPRVKDIRAFRDKRVYQNDGVKGAGGGNDFYESAVAWPVQLLRNVTQSINPDSATAKSADLETSPYKWYRNIFKF